jgi:hypothetical protein
MIGIITATLGMFCCNDCHQTKAKHTRTHTHTRQKQKTKILGLYEMVPDIGWQLSNIRFFIRQTGAHAPI